VQHVQAREPGADDDDIELLLVTHGWADYGAVSHDLRLDTPPIRLAGILDTTLSDTGLRLHRLPAWARAQIIDPAFHILETWPSGARIDFASDTTSVEIDAMLTRLQIGDMAWPNHGFDLTVDGRIIDGHTTSEANVLHVKEPGTADIEFLPGEAVTVRFDNLAPGDKRIEVWLPQNAAVELRAARVDDGASASASPAPSRRWVHYGSSISHCLEAERPTGVWPVVAARLAGVDLQSLGFAGECMIDQFIARIIRDMETDFISLKLGINVINGDTMRERTFVPAVHGFLDTVRDGHPTTPMVVVTPIICPVAEDHPGPTPGDGKTTNVIPRSPELSVGALTLKRIRELLATAVASRRDPNLHLVSGLDLFGEADVADLPDGLHPNAAGYQRMGERFHRLVFEKGGPFAGQPRAT
jgi:hypothetical protein